MEDTELRNYLGRIDGHLGRIDSHLGRIDNHAAEGDDRFDKVDARFDKVDARFAEVDARFDKVDARFAEVDARFEKVDARFDKMEQLVLREGERTRNHFDAVAEGLEDRIKLIAEGYGALRTDVTELKDGQQRLEAGQSNLDVHILALEARVAGVEKTQKIVLTEVRGLAIKVEGATRQL